MPQRNITGPILDAAGVPVVSGELHITPQVPAGTAADGFVIEKHVYTIADGELTAPVIVPGEYKIELFDAAAVRLRSFSAAISDASLADISLKEVWETRAGAIEVPPGAMLEGDSILRLAPGMGSTGDLLKQVDGKLVWGSSPNDMRSAVYDPHGRRSDVYNRANHTGSLPMSAVTGLSAALAAPGAFTEYAIIADLKPQGTHGGMNTANTDQLRTLNTVEVNNSGLTNGELLDVATSAVRLVPGRVYFGWADAPGYYAAAHYLIVKSTDAAVVIPGRASYAPADGSEYVNIAQVQFHIVVPAGGSEKQIQIFHRTSSALGGVAGLGRAMRPAGSGLSEQYARITILSRPIPA